MDDRGRGKRTIETLERELRLRDDEIRSLNDIALALSRERDREKLFREILQRVRKLTHSDGGALFVVERKPGAAVKRDDRDPLAGKHLVFKIVQNETLPEIERDFQQMALDITENSLVGYAAIHKKIINIEDAYHIDPEAPYGHDKSWDQRNNYRTRSILVVPLIGTKGDTLGVIELLNRKDEHDQRLGSVFDTASHVMPYDKDVERYAAALASQASVALENMNLFAEQKGLLESFIQMIAGAIDSKSPYTGAHCERVPILAEMVTRAAHDSTAGCFKDFSLTEEEWYELKIASWLHDCGKVTTPVHVMDKATKLETIRDGIDSVRARFEILRRDVELSYVKKLNAGFDGSEAKTIYEAEMAQIDEDLKFIEVANVGCEFLAPEKQERIRQIGQRVITFDGKECPLLGDREIADLQISRGTLNEEERLIINGHMVETVKMLEALPFPDYLKRVPEYASGHHEKMDGGGYPRGLYAGDMSIPARAMAIADVFEALTAQDRPYKPGKTLSEAMKIMGFMKQDNHLDPDLFDLFVTSGVYKVYGERFLPTELIDEVDEASLLEIRPKEFEMPAPEERELRWHEFLPEYRIPSEKTRSPDC